MDAGGGSTYSATRSKSIITHGIQEKVSNCDMREQTSKTKQKINTNGEGSRREGAPVVDMGFDSEIVVSQMTGQ